MIDSYYTKIKRYSIRQVSCQIRWHKVPNITSMTVKNGYVPVKLFTRLQWLYTFYIHL